MRLLIKELQGGKTSNPKSPLEFIHSTMNEDKPAEEDKEGSKDNE